MSLRHAAALMAAGFLAAPASAQVLDDIPEDSTGVALSVEKNAIIGFCPQLILRENPVAPGLAFGLDFVSSENGIALFERRFLASNIALVHNQLTDICEVTVSRSAISFDAARKREFYELMLRTEGFVLDPRSDETERVFIKTDGVMQRILSYRITASEDDVLISFSVIEA